MKLKITKEKNYQYHSLDKTSRQRVLAVLSKWPDKEFSLSDLAKEAEIAKTNVGGILEEFRWRGLIEIIKLSKIWRIKANQKSTDFINYKIICNLDLIYNTGIIEFLHEYFKNPKNIILFGSFRKGEDLSDSDIDIAIETDEADEYEAFGMKELAPFEKMLGRKIQIHLFNKKNVDINVFNSIANGIVLSGFLEVGL